MKQPLRNVSLLCLALALAGCSKQSEEEVVPVPAAAGAKVVSVEAAASPAAPPPGSPGVAAAAPAPISLDKEDRPVNAQGLPMEDLEFLNHLVQELNESRISATEIPQKTFRTEAEQMAYEESLQKNQQPVRELNELVTAGVLKELPPAPAGQQYTINPTTGKVVLQ